MVSFAEEPEGASEPEAIEAVEIEETNEAAGEAATTEYADVSAEQPEVATDADAEELETLEIEAGAAAYFDVPYVATYYFNPRPLPTDNVQIPLYLTDNEQSEYLKEDTSKKLDLIYTLDGVEKTISNIPLGDYTLTLGKLSAGNHVFSVQVLDKTTGMKSHKLYNDLWVGTWTSKVYTMTTADLTKYKINAKDSTNATDLVNTRDGLNQLFKDVKAAGYTEIKLLPNSTFRINGEDTNRKKAIDIPSNFTVDMNQSTFVLNPILTDQSYVQTQNAKVTPSAVGCLVSFDNTVDSHLKNGTLIGDRTARINIGLESDKANKDCMGEAINTVVFTGGKYCSISNLTIKETTGHTVVKFYRWGEEIFLSGYTRTAIFDGKEVSAANCSTSDYMDLSKLIARNASESELYMGENYMYVGHPQGYRGIYGDSAIVYVSFYDANKKYLETVTGYQYRKMQIPNGAKYARVTLLGTSFTERDNSNPDTWGGTVSIYGKHFGDYFEFTDIDFVDTRTCALAPANCNNLLVEGCTYTRCGNSITPAAVDFEDGAQECQDVYYLNNEVKVASGTMSLIDNYGFNHIFIGNKNHSYEIRNRVVGALVTGIADQAGEKSTIRLVHGDKMHAAYGRIMNNNLAMVTTTDIVSYDSTGKPVHEPNPVDIIIKDCNFAGGNLSSVPTCTTYLRCNFNKIDASNAKLVKCNLQFGSSIGAELYCYDCNIKSMDGSTSQLNWNQGANATRVFENCKFLGKTVPNKFLATGTFKNCEFEDISITAWASGKSNEEKVVFDGCTINSTGGYFFELGPIASYIGYSDVTFKNCTINHTGKNLVQLTAKPTTGSQLVFDNCTINKTSGVLVTSFDSYNLEGATNIGYNITFMDTPINSAVTVDSSKVNPAVIKIAHSETSKKNGILTENGKIYYYINDVKQTGWQTVGGKKYYFGTDYAAKTGLQTISSKVYYFDTNGVMQIGLKTVSGKVYYFGTDGIAKTGWQTVSNNKYYFGTDGVAKTGLQTIESKKYYFNTSGVMQTGWQTISSKKYYFGTDGAMQTGWQTISSKKYYLGTDGAMLTGWQTIDNKKYYLGTNGIMVTGTVTIDDKTYEFDSNGVFVKEIVEEEPAPELKNGFVEEAGKTYYYVDDVKQLGWKKIDSVWYYFGADGVMATKKWVSYSGDWYYFNADGTMATNKWVAYSGDWYYFGSNGIMVTNKWVSYKGDWYYFGDDGAMATDKWIAYKGDWYYFGADGIMVATKWVLYKDKWYYFDASGIMVTGTQTINGKQYTFNSNGVWVK